MSSILLSVFVLLVVIFAVWKDYRTYRKITRLLLIMLSGLLLIGYITEPEWRFSSSADYALLSEGFHEVDLKPAGYDSIYSLREEDKFVENRKWISSISMLPDYLSNESIVDIYGYGVSESLPKKIQWRNQLQEPSQGLILNGAPKQVDVGREFQISLRAIGSVSGDSILVLKESEYWNSLPVNDSETVTLTDQIYVPGPFSYTFEWTGSDTVFVENIYVRAVKPNLLTIGVLTYSPSFELNYLAEHLGSRGHSVISRSRVGKDRFRYDAINASMSRAKSFFDGISEIDLLILDTREFIQLSNTQKVVVEQAINKGLDVLLVAPDEENRADWAEVFSTLGNQQVEVQPIERLEERNWLPSAFQEQEELISAIPLLNMMFVDYPEDAAVLQYHLQKDPVSIRIKRDSGSVTGQLFYQTYSWLIAGKEEIYNRFWVDFLSRIITLEASQIEVTPQLPRIHEKLLITITQPRDYSKVLIKSVYKPDSLKLSTVISPHNFEILTASYWPRETGWHFVEYEDTKRWFFVYGNEWEFDSALKKYQHTRHLISDQFSEDEPEFVKERTKVPDWFWLIGFFVLQAILWGERKFK